MWSTNPFITRKVKRWNGIINGHTIIQEQKIRSCVKIVYYSAVWSNATDNQDQSHLKILFQFKLFSYKPVLSTVQKVLAYSSMLASGKYAITAPGKITSMGSGTQKRVWDRIKLPKSVKRPGEVQQVDGSKKIERLHPMWIGHVVWLSPDVSEMMGS